MERTPSVDEEQVLDFIDVTSRIQYVTKSTLSKQKGEVKLTQSRQALL